MTRYAPDHKGSTRSRILEAAGRLFRAEGYVASGVAKVMDATGLTVGGFYEHFDSKEALLSEVLCRSLDQTRNVLLAGLDDVTGQAFVREVARRYLSRSHRDAPADGCALPSLAAEVARQSDSTRELFEKHFNRMLDDFEHHMPNRPQTGLTRRDRAVALAALLVGGLTFARAVRDPKLSDQILQACKRFAVFEETK
jgi:TetR/AcrR family transcriptional regulator, transcriptional repressor for nem operon